MKPSVIFVDDDSGITESVKRSLKNEPYALFTAESAERCVELLTLVDAHVVVSDLQMPGISGMDLMQCLKDIKPEVVRVVLSGKLNLEIALELINQGQVFRCLEKPCSASQLALCIREALAQSRMITQTKKMLELLQKCSPAHTGAQHASAGTPSQELCIDGNEQYDLASLIRDAVDEVERLDRALIEQHEKGRPLIKKVFYGPEK